MNFTEIMSKKVNPVEEGSGVSLAVLMEITSQYLATLDLGLLGYK